MSAFLSLAVPVLGVTTVAAITKFHLSGEDLSKYDEADQPVTFHPERNSPGNQAVTAYLQENFIKPAKSKGSRREKLLAKRKRFDQAGLNREFDCAFTPAIAKTGEAEITGEWVQAEGADPDKRILYLHGGAHTVGSAISHRAITTNLAERTGCSVFAANYRLMPEHSRIAGVEDSRLVYKWILDNGPDGAAPAAKLAVAGDSAGGNLTLSLINWVRDSGIPAADAVVAISPAVDGTCTSPSIRSNFETDIMLQPLAGRMLKIPQPLLLWLFWSLNKVSPSAPVISPIFADLSGLPPTLVHVSAAEMLYDDARRYVAKAQSQGSPATLQSWAHMAHVFHAFDRMLPEAHQAFDEIAKFLKAQGVFAK